MNIAVQNVCFAYKSHPILQDVSLEVQKGQVVSIVGPNGAGKSTLLKCMVRLLKPQAGAVYLDGKDIAGKKSQELAKAMGYIPQNVKDAFPFTVLETVLLGRKPHITWEVNDDDFRVVSEVMHFLKIENLAERPLDQLSGGQKQKVFVARALAQQPEIFLFDEPTSNLDIRHQLEVFATIKRLAATEGRTVIVVVHDLNLAARFSDTLIMLKHGSIYAAGKPAEVITEASLREVYNVSAAIVETQYGCYVLPIEPLAETTG
ncbi:MAG TPA: ABC transporter ATP-binding protein [Methylomusa anaerophila]|uniref:Putative siderophore transport system ATP-binding protein YusV n=1 Tax=Methylomusa anaerophila TaxID=1930071 RepID=A0A348AE95_9FIRM|nr:ABC transporter ATP-binding protein [Methylomusa anaerophila]BBB89393.1 putative siderophore transport system ATP-binding protein YusV [Methylomusa anaerophila]HML90470.1 ABC transporter ATP-binding protein [Methylomusa anaerophila]